MAQFQFEEKPGPAEEQSTPSPLSVFALTEIIENQLKTPELRNVFVNGEIIQFSRHASGHMYFTLADKEHPEGADPKKKAIIKCNFFRFHNQKLSFEPKVGMEVLVAGSLSLYYPNGGYNINVRKMAEVGMGNLLLRIQQLKQKLINDGVIDPSERKELPLLPKKIGIVTGIGTAALRDILKQVKDRYANVNVLIAPALVQGDMAAESLAQAIQEISKEKWQCDLLIVGRGGGAPEDLMAFNDERVALAIHQCRLPVISAVGHQIDHPISDDVADVAAATPTDGAKLALPIVEDFLASLETVSRNMRRTLKNRFEFLQEKLNRLAEKPFYTDPMVLLEGRYQALDEIETQLEVHFKEILATNSRAYDSLSDFNLLLSAILKQKQFQFEKGVERLAAFSPLATLKRGFSVAYQGDQILRKASQVRLKQKIEIQLAEGRIEATADKIQNQ